MPALFYIFIFPGFLFLTTLAMWAEYFDRKLNAKLQNRVGPPWFQPLADFIKLIGKADVVPTQANATFFRLAPIVALASTITAFFYIPLWGYNSLFPFNCDLVVVMYLLTVPTLCFFVGGWYSTSLFCRIGSMRLVTSLFAYEVPLFMGLLAPAMLAGSWSLSDIVSYYLAHPWYWLFNLIGFVVALIALHGKLEKAPFDIPEAETEIVAGTFTEYSGRSLAFLRLTLDIEMVVGAALLVAVFLPFGLQVNPILAFLLFLLKVFFMIALFALARTIFARMRIDQMVNFCWQWVVPLAILQLAINVWLKVVLQ